LRALASRQHGEAEGDVLEDRHVPKQRVMLEDEPDAALTHRDVRGVFAVERDRAGVGSLEACDDPEQRRLARSRRAKQRNEFATADLQVMPSSAV
jgi:hypothetical protein